MTNHLRTLIPAVLLCLLHTLPVFAAENHAPTTDSSSSAVTSDWTGRVVLIPVKGDIASSALGGQEEEITDALKRTQKETPRLVIIEIDSYGGEVKACDRIVRAIHDCPAPTIAFITHKAVSGGAMVATACDSIVMMKGSRIGDIQPMMMMFGNTKVDERTYEKIEADIRGIMTANANDNGYPAALLQAMVSRSFQIYEVRFKDGQREFLKQEQYDLLRKNMDEGIDKREFAEPPRIVVTKGKLVSLDATESKFYGLASSVVPSRDAFFAEQDIDPTHVIAATIKEGSIDLTKGLKDSLGSWEMSNWKTMLLAICLIAGVAGLLTEAAAPGFGLPGAIGIIGFACFFITLFLEGRATTPELFLFIIGVALLVVEIVVIPGFGVFGIVGLLCLVGGISLSMLPDLDSQYMDSNFWNETARVSITLTAVVFGSVFLVYLLVRFGSRLPFFQYAFLEPALPTGRDALDQGRNEPLTDDGFNPNEYDKYLGKTGCVTIPLRPAGKVRLDDGEILDVVSNGELIEPDARVRVRDVSMNRILVDRASDAPDSNT